MATLPDLVVVVLTETESLNTIQKREENTVYIEEVEQYISRDKEVVPCILLPDDAERLS